MGAREAVDPLGRGGEQDPVPGLAGADRDAGGQVGLASAGRAEEDDVVLGGDEVQSAQVGDALAFKAAGVVEVLQGLAGGKPGGADATFAAVGLAVGDLALQARSQELFVGPGRLTGALGPARDLLAQRGGFQGAGQERQLRADLSGGALGAGIGSLAR